MGAPSGMMPYTEIRTGRVPAEAVAGTGGIYPVVVAPFTGSLGAARIVPDATITGVASNNKTLQVQNRGQAGSGTVGMASIALASGSNAPQADETPLTLAAPANLDFVTGDVLAVVSTPVGSGMVLPGYMVRLDLVRD